MEQQPPPAAADLDSLLLSHGGGTESSSSEDDVDHRAVDEILLNHSPSPPSSPSARRHFRPSYDAGGVNEALTGAGNFDNRRALLSHSSSAGEYNSGVGGSSSNGSRYGARVLPQLFGNGAIRPSGRPGAALAAAAAASRSIPTPHAAAIKLRRATTGAGVVQRSVSETTGRIVAGDDSSVGVSGNGVDDGTDLQGFGFSSDGWKKLEEEEGVRVGELVSETVNSGSENTDVVGEFSNEDRLEENSDEVAEVSAKAKNLIEDEMPGVGEDDEYKLPSLESQNASEEDRKDLVLDEPNVNEEVLSPSLYEKNEEFPVRLADESIEKDRTVDPPRTLNDVDGNGHTNGGEEATGFENVVGETWNGDDARSQSEEVDTFEHLVSLGENEDDADLQQKPQSVLKPLDMAEEIEKKQAFTGLHYEEGAAAQPMRLEGVRKDSTVIGYFDVSSNNNITRTISSQAFRRDHGSPQVVAVHSNYIAVGMSKGLVFVVPSKYTAHQVDNMDAKMTMLGLQGDRTHVPVTSMCFNQPGDLLFAGYGDGHYTVWDVQKVSALKVITEHKAPVVHLLYLGQDTQVTRQFNVVSGDSKGVVKLIRFSVVPWLNRISYTKSMKLLDETTSRVVCAAPLLYGEGQVGNMTSSQISGAVSTSSISSMMGGIVDEGVVIFITHQSALVAKVSPAVEVYAQIPKPRGVREGAMPYAAWRFMSQSIAFPSEKVLNETSDKVALLAIAWDQEIQIAQLLKSELKVIEKWSLESAAIGIAWLGDQMLAILTLTAHLYLFAKDGNLIHQTSFTVDGVRGDDLISYHIYFSNVLGNPEKAYQNSVAVRGATMYILGPEHLIVTRLLSWKERIEVLRKAGDWMGALNMAMTLYDGETHGVIDLPKNLDDIQRSVMPYLVELIHSYVNEVFSYISVACYNQVDQSDVIKEQYTRVGGVAVEFCVHIGRTDILFDDILSKFDDAHHKETFLELLEPYILKDMLGSLPPEIMQALVEHYGKKGWLQRIEQCVLHMDILSLDFNQIVRLCREHRLHCALIYLFNKGLDDFRTPLEELLVVLRNSSRDEALSLGYRMLVYLKYCFQGLAFPPGHGSLSPSRLPSLRKELLHFLLEDSSAPNLWAITSLPSNGAYANVLHLLELDTEATLEVLRCAFADTKLHNLTDSSQESPNFDSESAISENLIQRAVGILSHILDACYFQTGGPSDVNSVGIWPSKKDVGHMYDFIAYYVAYEQANVSREILSQILEHLTSEVNMTDSVSGKTIPMLKRREKELLSLLQVVPETQWDAPYLLHLSEKAQFYQVCGHIHAIRHQYVAALDSYMKATHEPIYAFSFIRDMLRLPSNEESDAFESAIISRIPDLVRLSREGAYFLIIDHFSGKIPSILSELRSDPESLFFYLKTVIEVHTTGTLNFASLKKVDVLDFPSARRAQQQSNGVQGYLEAMSTFPELLLSNKVNVTDELTELYFELLCRYDKKSVLNFLETSESYRVDRCLRLCQEYGITDAASFLLERVGEVGSALLLILSDLNDNFATLDEEIHKVISHIAVDNLGILMKKKVVAEILDIVHACIGLCQRNSPRLEPDESEDLWFQLLDSFCQPLLDLGNAKPNSDGKAAVKDTLDRSVAEAEDEGHRFEWKISKCQKSVHVIRKIFSIFIKEIVEGMIGYVRLPRIMSKLLSDNGNQEFGDFKLTILGMLGTYDFEKRILDTAKSLIEDDTYYTMSLLRKGASHGYAPQSLVCCICNSLLAKDPTESSIRLFNCGHAMHLNCELQENNASFGGILVGCPICIPSKKSETSNGKSKLVENGLVTMPRSRMHQTRGTPALHPHDHESADNAYNLHPPSRFELLHALGKEQKFIQIENMPQLRLAPPALYHEKIMKRTDILAGKSARVTLTEKTRGRNLRDVKLKGSSVRFALKSNIFGKETTSKR